MKVGDLVRYRGDGPGAALSDAALGLIMEGAEHGLASYKVWWMALNKTGWWDAYKLEKVESNK